MSPPSGIGMVLTQAEVDIRHGVSYEAICQVEDGKVELVAHDSEGTTVTLSAKRVFVATGRMPNTTGMGMERACHALPGSGQQNRQRAFARFCNRSQQGAAAGFSN